MMRRAAIAAALSLTAAPAIAAENPLHTFKDWVAGCDNGRRCMAVGQYPANDYEVLTVALERGPLAGDAPGFWFRKPESPVSDIAADGKPLGLRMIERDEDNLAVAPESMPLLVDALRSATRLNLVGKDGKAGERVSADGASAALRWIDDQQKRAGTVTALVARGTRPASAVPRPPALPLVTRIAGSAAAPEMLNAAQISKWRQEVFECEDEEPNPHLVDAIRLDSRTSLVMISASCASGAYNYLYIPVLLRPGSKPVLTEFEGADSGTEDGGLYNLYWNAGERVLSTYFKGRGIGDCGGGSDYVWDGRKFLVARESMMDDCRGATEWITTFRARIVDRR